MASTIHGIHHVTCIAGDPQENLDFYVGVMGLRLVKKSVNQDVPDTYHLFYADGAGTPGTDLTFFPWPAMGPGRPGVGLAMEVVFAVPPGSLGYWRERLAAHGVRLGDGTVRFGEAVLPFRDPHGLHLALVETGRERPFEPWAKSPVPAMHQLRGMDAVRLWERDREGTAAFLTDVLGFARREEEDVWLRCGLPGEEAGTLVELRHLPGERLGRWGTGAVHHVAWRVRDDEEELAVRERVERAGRGPTPVIDRFWFRSVYFREPGGVLFELATDGPGFDRDEDADRLGERLILPPWLERRREEIEAALPAVRVPEPSR
ncbi:MAG: ring-cleaving dioxygenase [Gemmatimonadales bacterium]|jgi:glyoxalase family protein